MAFYCRDYLNCSSCIDEECIWMHADDIQFPCRKSVLDLEFSGKLQILTNQHDCTVILEHRNMSYNQQPDHVIVLPFAICIFMCALAVITFLLARKVRKGKYSTLTTLVEEIELLSWSNSTRTSQEPCLVDHNTAIC